MKYETICECGARITSSTLPWEARTRCTPCLVAEREWLDAERWVEHDTRPSYDRTEDAQ